MKCNCKGWEVSNYQIIGAQQLAANHGIKYTGRIYKYCPWCGSLLEDLTDLETIAKYVNRGIEEIDSDVIESICKI